MGGAQCPFTTGAFGLRSGLRLRAPVWSPVSKEPPLKKLMELKPEAKPKLWFRKDLSLLRGYLYLLFKNKAVGKLAVTVMARA